jgi:hypothetical protein
MMRDEYKCIMADVLIQTRVPDRVAKWIANRADAEGDTIAGWTRRLFFREATMARVKAWILPLSGCDPQVVLHRGAPANYVLELLRELTPSASVYAVGHGEGTNRAGSPVRGETTLVDLPWFRKPTDHRVVLSGSPRPLRIVKALYNDTAQRLELTLDVDVLYPPPS